MTRLLRNRFVIVPLVICVVVAAWNVYVARHNHGLVAGRVIDATGQPASGATVILFNHDFVTQVEKARTRTDANGAFRFDANESHLIQLQAQRDDALSPRLTIRLWFRAEDFELAAPLQLGPRAG